MIVNSIAKTPLFLINYGASVTLFTFFFNICSKLQQGAIIMSKMFWNESYQNLRVSVLVQKSDALISTIKY